MEKSFFYSSILEFLGEKNDSASFCQWLYKQKINVADLLTNEVVGTGGLWPLHHYLRKPSLGTEKTFVEDIAKMYELE
jgi:hypothetical protein